MAGTLEWRDSGCDKTVCRRPEKPQCWKLSGRDRGQIRDQIRTGELADQEIMGSLRTDDVDINLTRLSPEVLLPPPASSLSTRRDSILTTRQNILVSKSTGVFACTCGISWCSPGTSSRATRLVTPTAPDASRNSRSWTTCLPPAGRNRPSSGRFDHVFVLHTWPDGAEPEHQTRD